MFFFLLFGRGPRPRPNSKKNNTPPPKQQKKKKKTRPRPFRACCLFAVWAGGCVYVFAVWAGGVFLFLLFGRGACYFFCCLGGGRFFFFLLFGRGSCSFFCCLGRGRVFFFLLFGRGTGGDGSSLTYRSAWLVFKRPNNKKDQTAKQKKTRVPSPLNRPYSSPLHNISSPI